MPLVHQVKPRPMPYQAARAPQQHSLSLRESRAAMDTYAELYKKTDDIDLELSQFEQARFGNMRLKRLLTKQIRRFQTASRPNPNCRRSVSPLPNY
ncbi:DNA mismatch repair protein [Neisseria gonorrhoeae]|nr:DNA mismatch repair protein [Neisseria gonorrhoeae]